MEIWKNVSGFESSYMVSNLGRIKTKERTVSTGCGRTRTVAERIRKTSIGKKNGYEYVSLSQNCKVSAHTVHRVVMLAFTEQSDKTLDINHINSIRTDNRITNLEWCTRSENMRHCYDVSGYKSPRGELNKLSKPVIMMDDLGNEISRYASARVAEASGDFHANGIARCCRGGRKHHRGYKWKYES